MVVNKRKKVTKYRAHTTHGGGHRKKRRGAGSRGGRGNAGSGKRAGQKKAGIKDSKLGNKGFTGMNAKSTKKEKTINVGYFTLEKVNKLLEKGSVKKENDFFVVDLSSLGYQKLLGSGNTKLKLKITVDNFVPRAEEKVKAAGGEINSEAKQKAVVKEVPVKETKEEREQ
ncbi:50S ribosomal protein L15 [Candidatus Woesearchaeota archaeon]|jgi:large subunit ribosomal protein L15|nr:50S ribosomal protein L15 [Candidatus Woesearchaeota archaeon]